MKLSKKDAWKIIQKFTNNQNYIMATVAGKSLSSEYVGNGDWLSLKAFARAIVDEFPEYAPKAETVDVYQKCIMCKTGRSVPNRTDGWNCIVCHTKNPAEMVEEPAEAVKVDPNNPWDSTENAPEHKYLVYYWCRNNDIHFLSDNPMAQDQYIPAPTKTTKFEEFIDSLKPITEREITEERRRKAWADWIEAGGYIYPDDDAYFKFRIGRDGDKSRVVGNAETVEQAVLYIEKRLAEMGAGE